MAAMQLAYKDIGTSVSFTMWHIDVLTFDVLTFKKKIYYPASL